MQTPFTSSGYSVFNELQLESGEKLDFERVPAFLRVLLTTDGTVTKSLESYFWEPVNVSKIRQGRLVLDQDLTSLEKAKGEEVISREVRLQGENSQLLYATARSYIRSETLPRDICRDLELDQVGIGELLRECGLETYRELMSFSKGDSEFGPVISRTYRIVMNGQPFIQITEKFPVNVYA